MKRILCVLSVLLVMILSGCSGHKEEQMELADTVSSIPELETSELVEVSTEVSEPTQIPTEITEPTELPTEAPDDMDDSLSVVLPAVRPEITADNLFQMLPSSFIFIEPTAWATEITLQEDGAFTGVCHYTRHIDEESYPFHGKFKTPRKVSEYIYSMELEALVFEQGTDTMYLDYDYNTNVESQKWLTVPKGFERAGEFRVYLPGCPLEDMPEAYLPSCSINSRIRQTIPSGVYRLYNVGGNTGFMAEDEDSFWSQGYQASNASLRPNYCLKSVLGFSQEHNYITLAFDWNSDTQTQFTATDREGTGTYNISLKYSKDYRTMTMTAQNTNGLDLEPWGGTADGAISAEFQMCNRLPFDSVETKQEGADVFGLLPSEFRAATAGIGGWRSILTIGEDGTFTGEYSNSNMGIWGPGYSHGSVSLSHYSGKFTAPKKISDYVYSMNIVSQEYEETPGTEYFEDGFRYYIASGLDETSEFRIYLPGCPLEEISFPEFSLWDTSESDIVWRCTGVNMNTHKTIPPGVYVICNLSATECFKAEDEDALLWNKTYEYNYGSYCSELQPGNCNYYSAMDDLGKLVFFGDTGLRFEFELDYDSQGEIVVTDSHGTGDYNLALDFSDDFNSVTVTIKSLSGFNLEPWGGTADGTLTAEYRVS